MDVTAELAAPCDAETLFRWVDDLGRYPAWLDIVPRAEPAEPHPDDPGPAWLVTLRGQLGPLARSKRLRMVRTLHEAPHRAWFERLEHDGRQHAAWVLMANVAEATGPHPDGETTSRLTMKMHYGGRLGGPPVRKLLADAITQSGPRLLECVASNH